MSAFGLVSAAADQVRTHRLRTALSGVSIVVGVATLTVVVALGDIAGSAARSVIERQAGRAATVMASGESGSAAFIENVMPRLLGRLDRYGLLERSPIIGWGATMTTAGVSRPTSVLGVAPGLNNVRAFRQVAGRWLEPADAHLLAPVVVANAALADAMSARGGFAVGSSLTLTLDDGPVRARLVGLVDDGEQEGHLYAPMEVLLRLAGPSTAASATLLFHVAPERLDASLSRLSADLRSAGLTGVQLLRTDSAEEFASLLSMLQLLLAIIAGISLVTGAIGILNLGLATTRQRAREFAIRRSFGAARRDIFVIVMLESLWTAIVGGAAGVLLASGAIVVSQALIGDRLAIAGVPPFPLTAAATGLVVAVVIGLVAGFLPARLATRVSIIETIRA